MFTTTVLALALQATAMDCAAFEAGIATPAPVAFKAISGERLGGRRLPDQPGQDARFQVGDLVYQGRGIEIRSTDPRLADLVIIPGFGVRHRCGNFFYGPVGWNANDGSPEAQVVTFQPRRLGPIAPGAVAAAETGVRPVLAGYSAGPTWPLYTNKGRVFLGLMYPDNARRETVIVAFAEREGEAPAKIVARLNERFEGLTVIPGLHTPPDYVNLDGFTADHALLQVVLTLPDSVKQGLFSAVSVGP